MGRTRSALLGALVVSLSAFLAHDARGEAALPRRDRVGVPTSPCPACRFDCPRKTTNCWACGKRLPGSPEPDALAPVEILVVKVLPQKKEAETLITPEAELERTEKWIRENPADREGAIERLEALKGKVGGTALEGHVTKRMEAIQGKLEAASGHMDAAERKAEAARMVMKVMAIVNKYPESVSGNIKRLEGLLKIVEGTAYENMVLRKITALRKKTE